MVYKTKIVSPFNLLTNKILTILFVLKFMLTGHVFNRVIQRLTAFQSVRILDNGSNISLVGVLWEENVSQRFFKLVN